ncbi:MAG: aldo/keto reductase [Eggerthellaceae bacterium]|nr:aldo/keto reductase [Eggerthellaceae bacterium]
MRYRKLGDIEVSAVGLGCMGMTHAYGKPADEQQMIDLIGDAVALGCTLFDTAECYGTPANPHENEELVGRALEPYRDQVRISTKFGLAFDWDDGKINHSVIADSSPEAILRSIDGSLKRLKTDRVDIYFQHRQDPNTPVEEVAEVMKDLIAAGKILGWGLSEVDEDTIRRAHAVCPVTAIQNRYSMMARWHADLFPVCQELGIGFMAFSPLANGFLSGKYADKSAFEDNGEDYRIEMPQFSEEAIAQNAALLEMLRDMANEHHATPAQISLAWMICKQPHLAPIPGTRKRHRLAENLGAADIILSEAELAEIDSALESMELSGVYGGTEVKAAQR